MRSNLLSREGLVPAILGTAVAATGATMLRKNPAAGYGILGFGIAHLVLGAIDLIEHR